MQASPYHFHATFVRIYFWYHWNWPIKSKKSCIYCIGFLNGQCGRLHYNDVAMKSSSLHEFSSKFSTFFSSTDSCLKFSLSVFGCSICQEYFFVGIKLQNKCLGHKISSNNNKQKQKKKFRMISYHVSILSSHIFESGNTHTFEWVQQHDMMNRFVYYCYYSSD